MGWRTVADVRDHSQATGSTYTVLIMLAERAPDETRVARPGLELLAADSRVSRRTTQRALDALEGMSEIRAVAYRNGGKGKATEWEILVGKGANLTDRNGANSARKGDNCDPNGASSDTPTKEPNEPNSHEPRAREVAIEQATDNPDGRTALRALGDVAGERGVDFKPAGLIAECRRYPDRDHVAEAIRFREHYTAGGSGENVDVKSLRGRWRTWLGRAPSKGSSSRRRTAGGRDKGPSGDDLRRMAADLRARGL